MIHDPQVALYVEGMSGLGDNLHQRALLRRWLTLGRRIWLETPWPCVYRDMPELRLVNRHIGLRAQSKNALREAGLYTSEPPRPPVQRVRMSYSPQQVRQAGSVLGGMALSVGEAPSGLDFRMPVPPTWQAQARAVLRQLSPDKPLMIYRPLVERREWSGCRARNPDHHAYAELFRAIRDRYFVISIADLDADKEWIVGEPVETDAQFHRGELSVETLAALTRASALVFASPGFAVVLAQAVETPVICVFGGYENSSSFSAGARLSPYLGIDPIEPCDCFQHTHGCRKAIDLPAAHRKIEEFLCRS